MTTPAAPNSISFSQVTNEIEATMISPYNMNSLEFRNLQESDSFSTPISLGSLRGKTWMGKAEASRLVANNWTTVFRHIAYPNGVPNRTYNVINGAFSRYSNVASYTQSSITFPNQWTRNSTAVVAVVGAFRPEVPLTSFQVNSTDFISRLGVGWSGVDSEIMLGSVDVYSTKYKDINSVSWTWTRDTSNRQSAAAALFLPGNWNYDNYALLPGGDFNSLTIPAYQVAVGVAFTGADEGIQTFYDAFPSGVVGSSVCTYWYNNSIIWFIVNTNSTPTTVNNIRCWSNNYVLFYSYNNNY